LPAPCKPSWVNPGAASQCIAQQSAGPKHATILISTISTIVMLTMTMPIWCNSMEKTHSRDSIDLNMKLCVPSTHNPMLTQRKGPPACEQGAHSNNITICSLSHLAVRIGSLFFDVSNELTSLMRRSHSASSSSSSYSVDGPTDETAEAVEMLRLC
jgi:hypothetical protein